MSFAPFALVLALMLVLVRQASGPLTNADTYFHLRFGHEFLGEWSARDPGSVTSAGTADWLPTQWLSQLLMAGLDNVWGLPGVGLLAGLLLVLLVLILYGVARQVAGPLASAVAMLLAIIASSPSLSMRPQLFSFILTALTWWVWHRARADDKIPWLIVPITWLWAMLHGMWPLGLIISLVAALGISLDGGTTRTLVKQVGLVSLAGIAAALTPAGPGLYAAVVEVSGRGQYFSEWASPQFLSPYGIAIGIMLGIPILVLAKKPDPVPWFDLVMLALAGAFAVYSIRTVPVAAALATPLVAASLQRLVGRRSPTPRSEWPILAVGTAVCLGLLAFSVHESPTLAPDQPDWLAAEMAALPVGTQVLNAQARGGYLMWRYPDLDFTMSGYGDIYTTPELERMVNVIRVEPGWDESVREIGAEVALVDPESALDYALRLCDWEVERSSDELELLRAPETWGQGEACSSDAEQP